MSEALTGRGPVPPDADGPNNCPRDTAARLDPWLIGVRVRELMNWLAGGQPGAEQPVMLPAGPPQPALRGSDAFSRVAVPAGDPVAVLATPRRRPPSAPTGPISVSSSFTMPERRAVLRRPSFEVSAAPVDLSKSLRSRLSAPPPPTPPPAIGNVREPIAPPEPPAQPAVPRPVPLLGETLPQLGHSLLPPAPVQLPSPTRAASPEREVEASGPIAPGRVDRLGEAVITPIMTDRELAMARVTDPVSPAAAFFPIDPLRADNDLVPEFENHPAPSRRMPLWPGFVVGTIAAAAIGYVLIWPAEPEPVEAVIVGAAASVLAPAEGSLDRVLVAPGARVTRGTELFAVAGPRTDPRIISDLAARIDLAKARETRLGLLAQEISQSFARGRPAADATAGREAELARQRLRDVQEQLRLVSEERTKLEQTFAASAAPPAPQPRIRSDRDGFVTRIFATEGEEVVPGQKLAELVDCSSLSLSLDAAAAAKAGMAPGAPLQLLVPNSRSRVPLRIPEQTDQQAGREVGRIAVPLDLAGWKNAGGSGCPLGMRVNVTRPAS